MAVQPGREKRALLGWNLQFGKQGHRRVPRIPIDDSAWAQSKNGYVLAHDSQYENPIYLRQLVKKKKYEGWNYTTNEDLDQDGENDTVLYDAKGKPVFWNGYHYVDKYPMIQREKFMHDPDNEKYQYKLSVYNYERKTSYDKVLTDIAKNCHEIIKDLVRKLNAAERRKKTSDLSTQFFKSFIKEALLAPTFIIDNKICELDAYVAELEEIAANFDEDKDYKMGRHREIMKIFRMVNDKYNDEKVPEGVILGVRRALEDYFTEGKVQAILNAYDSQNGFTENGDKLRFIANNATPIQIPIVKVERKMVTEGI